MSKPHRITIPTDSPTVEGVTVLGALAATFAAGAASTIIPAWSLALLLLGTMLVWVVAIVMAVAAAQNRNELADWVQRHRG